MGERGAADEQRIAVRIARRDACDRARALFAPGTFSTIALSSGEPCELGDVPCARPCRSSPRVEADDEADRPARGCARAAFASASAATPATRRRRRDFIAQGSPRTAPLRRGTPCPPRRASGDRLRTVVRERDAHRVEAEDRAEPRLERRQCRRGHASGRVDGLPQAVVEVAAQRLGDRGQSIERRQARVLARRHRQQAHACCCASEGDAPMTMKSMWPPIRSPNAGVVPLYGTCDRGRAEALDQLGRADVRGVADARGPVGRARIRDEPAPELPARRAPAACRVRRGPSASSDAISTGRSASIAIAWSGCAIAEVAISSVSPSGSLIATRWMARPLFAPGTVLDDDGAARDPAELGGEDARDAVATPPARSRAPAARHRSARLRAGRPDERAPDGRSQEARRSIPWRRV
jgi:hypothetical protein